MKKLTFQNQIILGIIGLGIGHLLWFLTDIGVFVNLAFILYGLLFLIHPVPPKSAQSHPRIRGYLRLAALAIILFGCTMKNGDGEATWRKQAEKALSFDAKGTNVVSAMDDHGGFQGEGTTYIVLDFSQNPITGCPVSEGWHDLPLTQNVQILIYGIETETSRRGPFLDVTLPQVEQGYWFFYDQQGESYSDNEVLNRYSYNYTFALYDTAEDLLYYCEFDT